ncbi:MAG: hypothetical protein ABR985_10575 [Methanotrichaceae archaeon]|jgi:hypothetical protein
MKKILCLALLVLIFLATGICTAKVPDLLGKWNGLESWYGEVNGSAKLTENKSLNVTVVEQKNRLVTGNMTYKLENGTGIVEGFTGAIGLDNKTLYFAEVDGGYDLGTIISNDEMELIYLQDGKMAEATIGRLHRITA